MRDDDDDDDDEPVLYNKKLKEFKQINVKDNAWSEVAKEVGANGMFNINKSSGKYYAL